MLELLDKKTLVAAKVWASHYPIRGLLSIQGKKAVV